MNISASGGSFATSASRPGRNDTVLYNSKHGANGDGATTLAVLYDYTVQPDDLTATMLGDIADVTLLPVGLDVI